MTDVTVSGLSVRYGPRLALDDVFLDADRGSILGIIGPNGSGKTTLLRALTGAVRPAAGTVLVRGRPVSALSEREVARLVAVVPQLPDLPAGFTASDVVAMGRLAHLGWFAGESRQDRKAIRLAMEQTDTLRLGARPIEQLSGGERQRVLVARALAQETPILLLDEPTSHLDPGHQVELLHLVRRLRDECQLTVVAVFHDLALAAHFCNRLVLLHAGRVLADGDPEQVLDPALLARAYGAGVEVCRLQDGRLVVYPDLDAYARALGTASPASDAGSRGSQ